jgi:hypothetical protein
VPKVVKPLWAALRGRDTAVSQRQGKRDGKHYDNSRIGFGRRWIQMRRLEPAFDGFSPFLERPGPEKTCAATYDGFCELRLRVWLEGHALR